MHRKTFNEYYKKVSPGRKKALKDFRDQVEYKTLVHGNTEWKYYTAGTGK